MVNAWSLAASVLNGTLDEDYPIVKKEVDEKTGLWKEPDPYEFYNVGAGNTAASYEADSGDTYTEAFDYMMQTDYMADVDDQRAHHFGQYQDNMDEDFYEPKRNHQYKYHEEEILKDIEEYVSLTYSGHYTGSKHEFRKVQTIDLMAARDIASQFCQANILKYGSRYGSKDGRNKKDLLKVIHYAMLLLHFDGHYGKPSSSDGSFDRMP